MPIDVEDLDLLLKLAEEGAVDVEWEQGDLVLLNVSTFSLENPRASDIVCGG